MLEMYSVEQCSFAMLLHGTSSKKVTQSSVQQSHINSATEQWKNITSQVQCWTKIKYKN
jgi:hypothetical protein